MTSGFRFALWQKRTGVVAMIVLVAALLALADALVGGLRGGHAPIELIPGTRYLLSGPLPPRTETIKDMVIDGQPGNDSVQLIPETLFSGYWFGGSMWRGAIVVAPHAQEGDYVFRVKDPYGEKQNPALVFTIRIWPNQAALNANSPSRLTRWTGQSPFIIAFTLALTGLAAMAVNFLCGRLWARHLHAHQCGEIYKLRQTQQGTEVTCDLQCDKDVQPGVAGSIYHPSGERICAGRVASCDKGEVMLLVEQPNAVRLGDVACVHVAAGQSGAKVDNHAI